MIQATASASLNLGDQELGKLLTMAILAPVVLLGLHLVHDHLLFKQSTAAAVAGHQFAYAQAPAETSTGRNKHQQQQQLPAYCNQAVDAKAVPPAHFKHWPWTTITSSASSAG